MSKATKISPFFANTEWEPRITTDLHPPARGDRDYARAYGLPSSMAEIHQFARTSMIDAQQRYQDQTDKQRTTPPHFNPRDLIWLLDAKIRYRKLQYLIKRMCHDIRDWRDAKDVNRLKAIDIFHQRYPHRPGPLHDDEEGEQD